MVSAIEKQIKELENLMHCLELCEMVCLRLLIDVKEGKNSKNKRKNSCNSFSQGFGQNHLKKKC
jgi:hypothetical protein